LQKKNMVFVESWQGEKRAAKPASLFAAWSHEDLQREGTQAKQKALQIG
jgi:hypothetical protein